MANLALLAAAGTIALFGWGWFDRIIQMIWPSWTPRTEQVIESPTPEVTTSPPVDEEVHLDNELRDLDNELERLFQEGSDELSELEDGL